MQTDVLLGAPNRICLQNCVFKGNGAKELPSTPWSQATWQFLSKMGQTRRGNTAEK